MAYVVNPNDASTPTNAQGATQGAEELRALKTKVAAVVAGAVITTGVGANQADLTTFIQPDVNDRPAIVAGGWLPWNLNQQWGGAPMPFHLVDSATGVEYKFDAATGFIDTNDIPTSFGNVAGAGWTRGQGFKVSKNTTLTAIWLKLAKTGNPVDSVVPKIFSDAAGVPAVGGLIANGTTNAISGKQISGDTFGQWYRFIFAAAPALVAGTQYHIVMERSGAVDAVNFYNIMRWAIGGKYPLGQGSNGTNVPVFAAEPGNRHLFLVENVAADQVVQSAGTFNGRIVGYEGNPINQSVGFIKPLREFFPLFHPNGWSVLIRGKSFTKDKTFAELIYGLHHDRINIRSATGTGFTTVTVYENDNTVTTVTGTSDISGAGLKDILIVGRSLNDGADYIKIYVGINNVWTKEAESLALSLGFDPFMFSQGHMWLMGGFPLFKNTDYTKLSEMGILPSGDGWTFTTTTATVEGTAFAISGGKLNQIKAGYAAGGDGNYTKAAAGFNNAVGGAMVTKLRVPSSSNVINNGGCRLRWVDGARAWNISINEYFLDISDQGGWWGSQPQINMKDLDNTLIWTAKGNDGFLFCNGKLVQDGTGRNTTVNAANTAIFGDEIVTAGENADAFWDYVAYHTAANIYPQFTSAELHEFGVWSGDKNLLGATLYNLGVPFSVKQYCGVNKNFVGEQTVQKYHLKGITASPTSVAAAGSPSIVPEMEVFCLGAYVDVNQASTGRNSAAGGIYNVSQFLDGARSPIEVPGSSVSDGAIYMQSININAPVAVSSCAKTKVNFGLHKIDLRFHGDGATGTSLSVTRRLSMEARAYG